MEGIDKNYPGRHHIELLERDILRLRPLQAAAWYSVVKPANGRISDSLNGDEAYKRHQLITSRRDGSSDPICEFSGNLRRPFMISLKPPYHFLCLFTLIVAAGSNSAMSITDDAPAVFHRQRSLVGALFDEDILACNTVFARNRAATLPDTARFDWLLRWVLPSETHSTIRMNGDFTQTNATPVTHRAEHRDDIRGGVLVSPVFDLLDLAKKTDRLHKLLRIIEASSVSADEEQLRARAGLLVLIQLELNQQDAAAVAAQQLLSLIMKDAPTGMGDQWPETLVVYRAIVVFGDHVVANDLIAYLHAQRAQRELPKGCRTWHNQIAAMAGRHAFLATGGRPNEIQSSAGLSQWISVSRPRAITRGSGNPAASWRRQADRVDNISAQDDEYLFFKSPLRGNYEVECDLTAPNIARAQVMVAGTFIGPRFDRKHLEVGTFRTGGVFEPFHFEQGQFGQWVHYRAVVREKVCRVYIDGLLVRTLPITEYSDPWVAIRSWGRSHGGIRNLRITGIPVIPDIIDLSGNPDLVGWIPYYEESVARKGAQWEHTEDPDSSGMIIGRRVSGLGGTTAESLLRYQRPLEEDGAVDYEFFYKPGSHEVYPALDRLVFVLHPDGCKTHWITDSPLDQSEIAPENVNDETGSHRGPEKLPLKANSWNRMTLATKGLLVSGSLNGQLIFERKLELPNDRTFGLFHYADTTEVRVRNVRMRGQWPKSLPPTSDQELAQTLINQLDADLAMLTTIFSHDFTSGGLPSEFFTTTDSDKRGSQLAGQEGIIVVRPTTGNWSTSDIRLPFALHGDFDVEGSFDQLQVSGDGDGCIMINVHLDDEKQHEVRLMRIRNVTQRQLVQVSLSSLHQDGLRSYNTRAQSSCEAFQGRLRIARRDDKVHFLFAENDSEAWQIIGTETVSASSSRADGVHLQTLGNGVGEIRVAWKKVTVRAKRLTRIPVESTSQRSLYMMNADGTDLHLVTHPALGFTHLGSTEWCADNRRLICDMSKGDTDSSHLILMNSDGTELKDLGSGCMPSLSPDGLNVVFSDPREGIVRMKLDGSNREAIERNGWGTQWSPDGRYIAWGSGSRIILLDTQSKQRRELLTPEQSAMLGSVYWNHGWSHDSKWIAFKARRTNVNDGLVVVASVESPHGFKVLYEGPNRVNEDFTWDPDNQHVVFAARVPPGNKLRLVKVSREHPAAPEVLPGQRSDWDQLDCDWSADGKHIVFAALAPPEPVDWPAGEH